MDGEKYYSPFSVSLFLYTSVFFFFFFCFFFAEYGRFMNSETRSAVLEGILKNI